MTRLDPATERRCLSDFRRLEERAMSRRLKQTAVVFIAVFAAAQLVRPERANPATDASRTIQAHVGTTSGLVAVPDRARTRHANSCITLQKNSVEPVR